MAVYWPKAVASLRILFENFERIGSPAYERAERDGLNKPIEMTVECVSAAVNINDYTEADTCSLEVDYRQFPFDPRTIRSLGVVVYMDNTEGGVITPIKPGSGGVDSTDFSSHNAVFQGFADTVQTNLGDSGLTVNIECRDFTALFIDQRIVNKDGVQVKILKNKPIEDILNDLIDRNPSTSGIIKILPKTDLSKIRLSQTDPSFITAKALQKQNRSDNFWDVMRTIAERAGLKIYMQLDRLVVASMKNLYADPNAIQMVFGRDLSNMQMARTIGRQKHLNIEVYTVDIETKRRTEVSIPRDATDRDFIKRFGKKEAKIPLLKADGGVSTQGQVAQPHRFFLPDAKNKETLISLGESLYEEFSRQQIEGSLATSDMDFPGVRIDPQRGNSILHDLGQVSFRSIKIGTPILVNFDYRDMADLSGGAGIESRKKYLRSRGYPDEVITPFAESLGKVGYIFYTKSLSYSINHSQGFSMDIQFVNFIELGNRGNR